jgi:hypothetical protein
MNNNKFNMKQSNARMNKISDNIVYHQEKDDGGKSSTS